MICIVPIAITRKIIENVKSHIDPDGKLNTLLCKGVEPFGTRNISKTLRKSLNRTLSASIGFGLLQKVR